MPKNTYSTKPVVSTVERVIHNITMMYSNLTRQDVTKLVRDTLVLKHTAFLNSFGEIVTLTYPDGAWITLTDESLYVHRQFLVPQPLANIYLYGTLDRYHYFDSTPYRVEEKPRHRCRCYTPLTQEDLVADICAYFGCDEPIVGKALSTLFYVRKNMLHKTNEWEIDFVVDDLSWPAIGVTRLNYGHLRGGEPRKKYTLYDLRQVIGFMRDSFIPEIKKNDRRMKPF